MSNDTYYAAVLAEVFMRGGNIHAVTRTRVEACEASGCQAFECATLELQLQVARDRVARDLARLTVVSQ
jgi:ABC-type amino acid transport system permease subunit